MTTTLLQRVKDRLFYGLQSFFLSVLNLSHQTEGRFVLNQS